MAEVIVAVFDTTAHADAAEAALRSGGIPAEIIRRYTPGEAGAPRVEATSSPVSETPRQQESGGFWAWLFGDEHQHDDRAVYDEHVSAGRVIVTVRTIDNLQSSEAMRILEGHSPTEVDTRREAAGAATLSDRTDDAATLSPGLTGTASAREAALRARNPTEHRTGSPQTERSVGTSETEQVIPLSEEELEVGKRTVDEGTTRIRRYVVETPVQQSVNLRDETTTVERRKPAMGTSAGAGAFEDRTVEVRETSEQPVVSKTAQVAEEVVVKKEGTERTETVSDTVRREEVEVDKSGTGTRTQTESERLGKAH